MYAPKVEPAGWDGEVNRKTVFLLVIVNGFVGLAWYRAWESGMSLARVIPLGLLSLAAVTAATILGADSRRKTGAAESRPHHRAKIASTEKNMPGNVHEGVDERRGQQRARPNPAVTVK